MNRILLIVLVFCCPLIMTATGCAAQLREMKGITRVGFSIQVGAFAEVANAERLSSRLQSQGIEAFYFKKDNGVYAVRFGDYPNRDEAKKAAQKLIAGGLIGAYFIASPQKVSLPRTEPQSRETRPFVKPKPIRDMGAIAARTAERFVGIPYQWGGNNVVEGMDCSGFVRAVFNLCGVNIPRTSQEQFRTGDSIGRDDLLDGDLVFFGASAGEINHVGIYIGNGRFVHAPRRGDDIKVSLIDDGYFSKKFIGAKRYF